MPRGDDLLAHGHGHGIGAPRAEHPDFRGRLEGRAEQAQVDALLHGDGQRLGGLSGQLAQRRIVSVQHAEEARGHGVGLGARDGVAAREVQLVGHDAEVADTKGLVDGAGGVGGDKRCRPEPGHEPHGEGDLLSGIALVAVKAPLHGEHALAAQLAGHEAPHVPVGRGYAHAGHLTEGDEDRVGDALSQRTEPRSQDKAHLRPESAKALPHHRFGRIQRLSQVIQSHGRCPS